MTDPLTDYQAFRTTAGALELSRDFVRAAGPDATSFLQGQLSQDVGGLAIGASTWALLLQPQGKMVALLRVLRVGDEEFVLETDTGYGAAVVERLNRFKLRVKCDLDPLDWRCVAVRGPASHDIAPGGTGTVVVADWPGLDGADLVGPSPEPPAGAVPSSLEAYEAVRIEAGIPVMGRELDERTIPAEAGVVERSVSFTKGCYTGQELVARIDSRGGNVPRRLRGLVLAGDAASARPPSGATVRDDAGKDVGEVTSVAFSPRLEAVVALAYVRRAVEPPAGVDVAWEGGSSPARVEALPLVP
jgi:folate-binding protein YgfZ